MGWRARKQNERQNDEIIIIYIFLFLIITLCVCVIVILTGLFWHPSHLRSNQWQIHKYFDPSHGRDRRQGYIELLCQIQIYVY